MEGRGLNTTQCHLPHGTDLQLAVDYTCRFFIFFPLMLKSHWDHHLKKLVCTIKKKSNNEISYGDTASNSGMKYHTIIFNFRLINLDFI